MTNNTEVGTWKGPVGLKEHIKKFANDKGFKSANAFIVKLLVKGTKFQDETRIDVNFLAKRRCKRCGKF